jgi:hypothetical protein
MLPPFKLGDLVTPNASMQAVAGFSKGDRSFWAGVPGLVVRMNDGGVDVLSCDEIHRNVKFGFIELFSAASNN